MPKCTEYNCTNEVQARGLCSSHYGRWLRSEVGQSTKMKGYGHRKKHPLYECWRHMNRMNRGTVCLEWSDFWIFVNDVVEKPARHYRLMKIDHSKPLSKDNYEWVEKAIQKREGETGEEFRKRYARERHHLRPDESKHYALKRYFGIGLDEYNAMLNSQNNQCAICEITTDKLENDGRRFTKLSVDHCHTTGKIRGLLCGDCNRALGLLKDNIKNLKKSISYIEKYQ